jgi:tagatose 1,6-diphosphate aldolase
MFQFQDIKRFTDSEIDLVIKELRPGNEALEFVPSYVFSIHMHNEENPIGQIDLRVGHNRNTFYGGNIGYSIVEAYRGHGYGFKAVKLLFDLASVHRMGFVIITCNPDNIASRKTAERSGAILLEVVDLPEDNDMYLAGERSKCRYEIKLS